MNTHDFIEKVKEGEHAEELVLSKFKNIIQPIVMRVMYKEGLIEKELQKQGVDAYIQKKETGFDVKVRDFKYYRFQDILLETKSVIESDTPGWLYKASVVVYVWWNPKKTRFVDGYALFMQNIRDWLEITQWNFYEKTAFSRRGVSHWSTKNIAVPITSFPLGCLYRLSRKEFMDNNQVVLDSYFDNKGFVPSA